MTPLLDELSTPLYILWQFYYAIDIICFYATVLFDAISIYADDVHFISAAMRCWQFRKTR